MNHAELISRTKTPLTTVKIMAGLRELGIRSGMTILCHSSLSSLGWVNGGEQTVLHALMGTLGPKGTLVMPSQTWNFSNPVLWCNPPVPEDWWQEICETMPAWDPDMSPTTYMGCIAETFRSWRGTIRSNHPQNSFAARGKHARRICRKHHLDFGLGENSPLGTLYQDRARILMLGTKWNTCTAIHLAEHRCAWEGKSLRREFAPMMQRGPLPWQKHRVWTPIENLDTSTDDFNACGSDFEAAFQNDSDVIRIGTIGNADCKLVDLHTLVDFATSWLPTARNNRLY